MPHALTPIEPRGQLAVPDFDPQHCDCGCGCDTDMSVSLKTTSLVPWFGTNRMTAANVADKLSGLSWLGVTFAGGMSELAHVSCRSIVVNDLHKHVVNLAVQVARHGKDRLVQMLDDLPFHPDVLAGAQVMCKAIERGAIDPCTEDEKLHWAAGYFITAWMGRSAKAGTVDEFSGNLSTRWTSSGGDSNTRYRSAIQSIEAWQRVMQRCNFSVLDFRDFLVKCKDETKHGVYSDPPFPDATDSYKHNFTEKDHRDLADLHGRFQATRVVVRYYDHPLIRELYPTGRWTWHEFPGRKQSNAEAPEVLITRGSDG